MYDIPIIGKKYGSDIINWINKEFGPLDKRLPQPFADEILGLSLASGATIGELVFFNLAYEIFTFCTSIVALNSNNTLLHGRNLDFGIFPAYNFTQHDWDLTDLLRPTLVDLEFHQNGSLLYHSVQFMGYVGVLSGMKPGVFSVTVDDHYDDQFDIGLIEWLMGRNPTAQFLGFFLRNLLQSATSYEEAFNAMNTTRLISPVFFIMSGPEPTDGAVITREKTYSQNVWTLQEQIDAGSFYLLETNYDHWEPVPWYDNRRGPGEQCMNETGPANLDFATLYNVLDTKPVRNQLTTYTVLMCVATGAWEVYLQYCSPPCAPW